MDITHISVPYVYPLCPLNFNHAKMFVVADVFARYAVAQNEGLLNTVIFPIASHFTGNTAQSTSIHISEFFAGNKSDESIKVFNLYKNQYKVPIMVIKEFENPHYLMSYFNQEIIWELRSLDVSCDYKNAYTTETEEFVHFVRAVIKQYEKQGLLIRNNNNELAINYDDPTWRKNTIDLIERTEIIQSFQKNVILSAFKNLSSNWELLRNSGFGVEYDEKGMIIDPMFDSELFMIFDLFIFWKNHFNQPIENVRAFFEILLQSLKENRNSFESLSAGEQNIANSILNSLPCNIFIGEEHLKNWIGKKFFAEQNLLHTALRTKKYQILGIGMLDGNRMSASRGHSVFSRDLINEYGGQVARLVILLSGGNISKTYNYDRLLPHTARKMLLEFTDYLIFLKSAYTDGLQANNIDEYDSNIGKYINDGYLQRAVIELLVNIPAQNKRPNLNTRKRLLELYRKYLNIFLPECGRCLMP